MKNQRNNQEVWIEETFNASQKRVFEAWTNPQKLAQWFAPDHCTIIFKKIDVKTGGSFHSCIANPEYGDCWCIGEYKEVSPYSKIVFTMINADENGMPINPVDIGMDPNWPGETLVTVNFHEINGKTKLTLHQTVSQELATKTGAYPSWLQMLSKAHTLLQ